MVEELQGKLCQVIHKNVISVFLVVCLSVCLSVRSKLRNFETNLPQIFIGKLGRTTGMFLAWFKGDAFSRLTFTRKIWCPVKAGFLSYSLIFNVKTVNYNFLNIFLG